MPACSSSADERELVTCSFEFGGKARTRVTPTLPALREPQQRGAVLVVFSLWPIGSAPSVEELKRERQLHVFYSLS